MIRKFLKYIASHIPSSAVEQLLVARYGYARISYAQHGEDLLLNDLVHATPTGFYVDIGAHHPTRFSNTFLFYKRGWRGINIDAATGSMRAFTRLRPHDINIEAAISEKPEDLMFYMFEKPALNTFNPAFAREHQQSGFKLKGTHKIRTQTLKSIFDAHLPPGNEISFLTIDVEGLEAEILRSNDWNLYRPHIILIEDWKFNPESLSASPTYTFLKEKGYHPVRWTEGSVIYSLPSSR
jgi:FkbM family methyltransferase